MYRFPDVPQNLRPVELFESAYADGAPIDMPKGTTLDIKFPGRKTNRLLKRRVSPVVTDFGLYGHSDFLGVPITAINLFN